MDNDRWLRHTVAVPNVTRTIDRFTRIKGRVARVQTFEMVHVHDCFRQVVNGKVLDQLWHRGAKVSI